MRHGGGGLRRDRRASRSRDRRGLIAGADGPTRVVEVAPERLARWFANFADRNGGPVVPEATADGLRARAANGTEVDCAAPFALTWNPVRAAADPIGALSAHALADRRVGVLLVRLGGYAAGVFDGTKLVESKVGSRQVHGRTSAGGWSQQRFARRRENQVDVALDTAAEVAARILAPHAAALAALVLGGERTATDKVLADRRLSALGAVAVEPRYLSVPDPKHAVLLSAPAMFRAVRIRITDPA